ncbi:MAG: phenylalanine--tRNA ligase subunit beta [candidate division WOR-3 bacterium]
MLVPVDWLKDYLQFDLPLEELAQRLTMGGLEVEEILSSPEGAVLSLYITPNRGDCLSIFGIAREVYAMLGEACQPTPLFEQARRGFGALGSPSEGGEAARWAQVEILDPDLCPRYAARIITGLKIAPSPALIQRRLIAAGMRPISNVVDATNYVMLELGQPLHAFDLAKLKQSRIVVRQARPGERIRTLDGVERPLEPPMLLICDAERPVAVAGVMGGAETEVSERTTTILLESAHFNPLSVRRTARALDLRTEASYRFERYVDPNLPVAALNRVCALIEQMTGVAAVPGVLDVYPYPVQARELPVRLDRADLLLGYPVPEESAIAGLKRLGLQPRKIRRRVYQVTLPTYRADLQCEEDLVEEVGRIVGYERIPESPPIGVTTQGRESELGRSVERVRQIMLNLGLQEVLNPTLEAPSPLHPPEVQPVPLRNPMSEDLSVLRPCLLAGLVATADHNWRHGVRDVQIFEIARVFRHKGWTHGQDTQPTGSHATHGQDAQATGSHATHGQDAQATRSHATHGQDAQATGPYEERMALGILLMGHRTPPSWQQQAQEVDFYTLKGIVEHLLARLEIEASFVSANDGRFHPARSAYVVKKEACDAPPLTLGILGELHPEIVASFDFKRRVYAAEFDAERLWQFASRTVAYRPLPRYPAVLRDIAFLVEQKIPYAQIASLLQEVAGEWLEAYHLFDRYTGGSVPEGWHSLAFSLTFRHPDRSLTDEEVNERVGAIFTALETQLGARRRG